MKKDNRLGWYMLRRRITTDALTGRLTDGNATAINLFEQGKALPTKNDLRAISDALRAKPTDIWDEHERLQGVFHTWDEHELDLLELLQSGNGRQHGTQTEFRCWIYPEDKRKLEVAIKQLGFKTQADWFREVSELTMKTAAKRAEKRGI